jgi:hypothetical protein
MHTIKLDVQQLIALQHTAYEVERLGSIIVATLSDKVFVNVPPLET